MGKRSDFERKPRDFYKTPKEAILPLLPHIYNIEYFIEPCAGDGQLVDILENFNKKCLMKTDIEPQREDIDKKDILQIEYFDIDIITNPPWDRNLLNPILDKIINNPYPIKAWLLFDADWIHIKKSIPYLPYLQKIVSIGRVKWFPETKMTGKDNCCWYLFSNKITDKIEFVGR